MNEPQKSKYLPAALNAFLCPGLGQIYLKEKIRGYVLVSLSLGIILAAFVRFMSVLFALTHVRAKGSFSFRPFHLMAEAWHLDQKVLLAFAGGFFLVWLISIIDVLAAKPRNSSL